MKLYQALKQKNKLAGEIKALEQLLQQKNSRVKTQENKFDVGALFGELSLKRKELVELKTSISVTNTPIQGKIFTLSELKAEAAFYSRLPTKEGLFKMNSYGPSDQEEYVAHLDELEVSKKRKEIEESIEKLQEELDYFNHTTDLQ
jgi:hypothetical protein